MAENNYLWSHNLKRCLNMAEKMNHQHWNRFTYTNCFSPVVQKAVCFTQLLSLLIVCCLYNIEVWAQTGENEGLPKGPPWNITADEIQYDSETGRYFATGDVLISKEDLKLSADRVHFYHRTMEVFAEGNVMLISGKDILAGKHLEMDLNKQVGMMSDGVIFIEENHFFIRGQHIQKTGKDSYRAETASITTCPGEEPDWKITARNVQITVEGYGTATHTTLWAKNLPVLYSPYLRFPVKLQRQTGFLTPQFGFSDRRGTEYMQPFFWAIDESSDATFYGHFMSLRGAKLGIEYRYILTPETKGALMADFLKDRKVDDGTGNTSARWGYTGDSYLRPNNDRYWFRGTHNQKLPSGFSARLDLDIVSDQDYLQEFKDGYSSFSETKDYFLKEFARDLDDYNDPVRVNQLRINKNWNLHSFNTQVRWYDNVIKRRLEDRDPTLHKLPSVSLDAVRQPLAGSLFFYDLTSDYTYFFRKDSFTGHRLDIHPRFYLPLKYKNYLSFESSVGLRETLWYLDDREDFSENNGGRSFSRELADARFDLSTDLSRTYSLNSPATRKIRHSVRPQITYDFIPQTSQNKLPEFDEIDRIKKSSIVTYTVTNTFSLGSRISGDPKKQNLPEKFSNNTISRHDEPAYAYRPFGRLKLQQSYDFNETIENRPFSPIFAELYLTPNRFFFLRADAQYSTHDNRLLTNNIASRISNRRGDRLFFEHRYAKDFTETFYGDAIIRLHDRISMFTEYERNVKNQKTLLYGIGFLYMTPCWSVDIGYSNEEGDKKYAMMINLYGIGGIGRAYAGKMIENPFEFR